ncbi:MAG: hypothetical protein ABSD74_03045 [Rhizomicrobium sp.]
MTRRLLIHIGPAKTGTSAVQHVLRSHDNSVVLYPKAGRWPDGSHHNLAFNFFEVYGRAEVVRESADNLFDRIATEARQSGRDVLVSSEVLAGRKRLPQFVEALLAKLGPEFEPEVLCVVRDHFERASSVYNQRVKDAAFNEQREPDEFLAEQTRKLCYAPMLKPLLRAKFKVTAVNYHPADSFVRRVLALVGFRGDQIAASPTRNMSLSPQSLVATLAANRVCRTVEERNAVVAMLQAIPNRFAPAQFIFGDGAAATADVAFEQDRSFVRTTFGVSLPVPARMGTVRGLTISSEELAEIDAAIPASCSGKAGILGSIRQYLRA